MFVINLSTRAVTSHIDLYRLLNREEVLSFSFDENSHKFSYINIQTKSLNLYTVDYINKHVKKMGVVNIMNRSIFKNMDKSYMFDEVKEFI